MYEAKTISEIDKTSVYASEQHWDNIGKPLNGLGKFEKIISQIAGIQHKEQISIKKKAVIIMCSDNGVCCENVTQTKKEVTAIVTENFAKGIASVNAMARLADATIFPIDIGIDGTIKESGVINKKVAYGSGNIATGPAMTKKQCDQAIQTGIDMVKTLKEEGYDIIATGEMGIGNTTTSSAITSVLLNIKPERVTGKGAGLSDNGIYHKIEIIKKAIAMNRPDKKDSLDVLAKLGGYDIAGLCGVFIGGALYHIPIIIDGFISATAALVAHRLNPFIAEYMIGSHLGKEPATSYIMKELGIEPIIHGELALGEGTGAVYLFPLLDMTVSVYNQNKTFQDIKVEQYQSFEQEVSG